MMAQHLNAGLALISQKSGPVLLHVRKPITICDFFLFHDYF